MTKGCVYLVGAGPGDPGLITVRGREVLSKADVVVYDHLVSPRLLDYAPAGAERVYVGKQASAHTLSQEQINQLLVERARGGDAVVRLKGGDPFVFGRGGEEALALVDAGLSFEVVPGVTAGIAAAAYAGIPVTHRLLASNIGLITGHEAPDKCESALDWQALANWKGTLGFYMGVASLPRICRELIDHGLDPDTPAALIRWGTTPRQEVLTGTVADVPALAEEADFKPPAIIIIGQVVALREKLTWYERRPLFAQRIVVTRARSQASRLSRRLEQLGAEVIEVPTIRIEPPEDAHDLKQAIDDRASFEWIIFTSVNGVDAFWGALAERGLDSRALASNKICAIGPATAERLGHFGIRPDAQPPRFTGAAVVETLASLQDLSGVGILCPRADIAPSDLPEALAALGARVRNVVAYRTVPESSDAAAVAEMFARDEIDWLTFTSSSTVKNFFSVVSPDQLRSWPAGKVRIASIGPSTSAAVRDAGFAPAVE
ncbi:MAG: uroporphyrinogen-III C-methyltransferase, partial [Planctomycetia bacterium]|nr:uroporphyrinogen-III C-methyltransferase [Planctomycetia bacterium]